MTLTFVKDGVVHEMTEHGWAGVLPGIDAEILAVEKRTAEQDTEVEAA